MPRSGTTYLYHALKENSSFFLPVRKELCFFSYHYEKGEENYYKNFKGIEPGMIGFDISPIQYFDEESWIRIKEFNKEAKVILIVREPNSWLKSYVKHNDIINVVSGTKPEDLLKNGFDHNFDGVSKNYNISDGDLQRKVNGLKACFGDNLLLLDYADLGADPLMFLREIESFLVVKPEFSEDKIIKEKINASDRKQIKALEYLMQNKYFIFFVTKMIPKSLVEKVRFVLDKSLARKGNGKRNSIVEPDNYLPLDHDYYKLLFDK